MMLYTMHFDCIYVEVTDSVTPTPVATAAIIGAAAGGVAVILILAIILAIILLLILSRNQRTKSYDVQGKESTGFISHTQWLTP